MIDPAPVPELLSRGIAAAKAGQAARAREALLQAVELDESNEQAWLWLSGVVESLEERRTCLENVLAINPDNPHARAGMQWLEQHAPAQPGLQEPKPPAAEDLCPRCGSPVPASAVACPQCELPLIVACPACGEYSDVTETSCRACGQPLGDFRQGAAYHLALARAYAERLKLDRAEDSIAQALAAAPQDPDVLEGVAGVYEKMGQASPAMATYEQAIEARPDRLSLYVGLAGLYRQQGRTAEARALYEKAVKLAGRDPAVVIDLARLRLEEEGVTPETAEMVSQIARKQPMNADANLLLGDLYVGQERWEDALRSYEHVCRLAPADSPVRQEALRKLEGLPLDYETQGRGGARASRGTRPGCITLYAALGIIGALVSALGALGIAVLFSSSRTAIENALLSSQLGLLLDMGQIAGMVWIYVGVVLFTSALTLTISIGLWLMKNWARWAVIILQTLSLVGAVAQAVTTVLSFRAVAESTGMPASFPTTMLAFLLLGFVIQGYILFWFVANGDLFD